MSLLHSLGYQKLTELAGQCSRHRLAEEDPDVPSVTGSRPLKVSWNCVCLACCQKSSCVFGPFFFPKSTARNRQVSSVSNGYAPTVICPSRCCLITPSVTGEKSR